MPLNHDPVIDLVFLGVDGHHVEQLGPLALQDGDDGRFLGGEQMDAGGVGRREHDGF